MYNVSLELYMKDIEDHFSSLHYVPLE
jgi:hypothetical protein